MAGSNYKGDHGSGEEVVLENGYEDELEQTECRSEGDDKGDNVGEIGVLSWTVQPQIAKTQMEGD